MLILVSNDDGVYAEGLSVLAESLRPLGQVIVAAPLEEKSTTGHSLTLHKPLRIHEVKKGFYGINGSPADCVYLACRKILKRKPDWVISGINRGANLGQDVYYSGTVSAAREAAMMGHRAISVSLAIRRGKGAPKAPKLHFKTAGKVVLDLIRTMNPHDLPDHTLLNVNVPNFAASQLKGIVTARQGFRYYSGKILTRKDHRGVPYYWIGGEYQGFRAEVDADCHAVEHKKVSVTPIQLDSTHYSFMSGLEQVLNG